MFTSRAEHRLALRHDNADRRLTPVGAAVGLVDAARAARLAAKSAGIDAAIELLAAHRVEGATLLERLRRPEVGWSDCVTLLPALAAVPPEVALQVETDLRYEGYVRVERSRIERQQAVASRPIPESFSYGGVRHLRAEAREQLERIRPRTLGQAGRVRGITPADVALVLIHLESRGGRA
jgi:tRNA uridine 5-carboxymethylaminomethyl modification enzyme